MIHALTSAETTDKRAQAWDRANSSWKYVTSEPDCIEDLAAAVRALAVQGVLSRQDKQDEPVDLLLERTRLKREQMVDDRRTRLVPDAKSYERSDALPPGWVWAPLQDLVRFIDYRGRTPTKTTTGVPLITAKNIRRGYISETPREYIAEGDFDGWMTRGLPRVGDVLFTTEAPMGNAALIREDRRFALAQRTITLAPYAELSGEFLETVLLSPWFQTELELRATGMTATGIKAGKLRLIRIPVPPREEQDRIAAVVANLLEQVADLGRSLQRSVQATDLVAAVLTAPQRAV